MQPVENKSISKNLVIPKKIDYDTIEDMKNTRANISPYKLRKLKY
jgi:hypothetical protein